MVMVKHVSGFKARQESGKTRLLLKRSLRSISLLAALVFVAPSQVALSVINGRVVVEDGELLTADLPAMIARHNALSREMTARAAQ